MKTEGRNPSPPELNEEDKSRITVLFLETMIPKLRRHHARVGALNCGFAGERYRSWNLRFTSAGPDFRIMGFEYDADTREFDLDT
ncbi:MAG: hypothetical protein ACOWYE_10605 [Desulfatiglandales bacterium]